MSDLLGGTQVPGPVPSSRGQNGNTRVAQGSGPIPAEPQRINTPTQVLERRKRRQEEARRLREGEQRAQEAVAGVEPPQPSRIPQPQTQTQRTGQNMADPAGTTGRIPVRPPGNVSTTSQPTTRTQPPAINPIPTGNNSRLSENTQRNRAETYETLSSIPATARPAGQSNIPTNPLPNPPQPSIPTQQPVQPPQQPRPTFPHAFERWESLSSQWEGITSFWIRRLQENTNELSSRPIDQQMARQITDLSAAGANLFHAVVELQRLRASSERKFQRWYFETRDEQEQAQERFAELERELQQERQQQQQNTSSVDAVQAEKSRADELVREMRRELQISKEEARRAWEELGRREQEERERTIALRQGEPTVIGGVQVVPMQGVPSRQFSTAHRPTTAHGPYPGGPGPGIMGGQQPPTQRSVSRNTNTTSLDSPGEEQHHFTYQPTSPGATESSRANEPHQLRHEPDTQFFSSPGQSAPASGSGTGAGFRVPTSSASPSRQYGNQPTTRDERYYQPSSATASGLHPPRAGSDRPHLPSVSGDGSSVGEEEYHINPDGSYTRDVHGRRIPYGAPIGGDPAEYSDEEDEEEDDDDYAAEQQAYTQSYRPQGLPQPTQQRAGNIAAGSASGGRTSAYNQTTIPNPTSSTSSSQQQQYAQPQSQQTTSTGQPSSWDSSATRRQYHEPSRLSDILEEASGRTDPSRTSYISGLGGNTAPVVTSSAIPPSLSTYTTTGGNGNGQNITSTSMPPTTSSGGIPISLGTTAPPSGGVSARR